MLFRSEIELDEDGYAHHEDDYYGDDLHHSGKGRQIAFYLILAAICIGCLFAIYNMIFGGRNRDPQNTTTQITTTETAEPTESLPAVTDPTDTDPVETTDPAETTEPVETTAPEETTAPAETTVETTAETTAASGDLIATHTVEAGETLWSVASRYYPNSVMDGIEKIKIANDLQGENPPIVIGQQLKIPQ